MLYSDSVADRLQFGVGLEGRGNNRILPVFMPFAGCAERCIFCAQTKQSGSLESGIDEILFKTDKMLAARSDDKAVEMAFFGGTFTKIPLPRQKDCLELARKYKKRGIISAVRCSTRPDACEADTLLYLKKSGLDLVELGVQSFDDNALNMAQRGYTGADAITGCATVAEVGLRLGIQLMPGMPGVSPRVFLDDVRAALACAPACMRFYPCMVIEGSELARLWKQGKYAPWDLRTTVDTLGEALALAWMANVPVIRIGLAPEPELLAAILAGPWRPALGSMVQGTALLKTVKNLLREHEGKARELRLPRVCQGFVGGHDGDLWPIWAEMGIFAHSISWHSRTYAELYMA
jgi:histone acetyltransferase (RNA polymerase elongator complex component)